MVVVIYNYKYKSYLIGILNYSIWLLLLALCFKMVYKPAFGNLDRISISFVFFWAQSFNLIFNRNKLIPREMKPRN
jgi:hypothetical protein